MTASHGTSPRHWKRNLMEGNNNAHHSLLSLFRPSPDGAIDFPFLFKLALGIILSALGIHIFSVVDAPSAILGLVLCFVGAWVILKTLQFEEEPPDD